MVADSCILSKFHIKPQLSPKGPTSCFVVSYRNSTSNHNTAISNVGKGTLYLIEIPHQTTTQLYPTLVKERCILSKFHIKPQLYRAWASCILCCILSKFHIKPQHRLGICFADIVVSYRNSTSNHNGGSRYSDWLEVVSYRNSTSNHNNGTTYNIDLTVVSYRNSTSNHNVSTTCFPVSSVVSYRNSTSNHNMPMRVSIAVVVVSYRNSTSNHNLIMSLIVTSELYLIEIPHQTTTASWRWRSGRVVSYRNSTSNHNVGPHID